eukprot:PDM76740.1 hypothetical protein PRIPAC_42135 [Pristionchus pacificus]
MSHAVDVHPSHIQEEDGVGSAGQLINIESFETSSNPVKMASNCSENSWKVVMSPSKWGTAMVFCIAAWAKNDGAASRVPDVHVHIQDDAGKVDGLLSTMKFLGIITVTIHISIHDPTFRSASVLWASTRRAVPMARRSLPDIDGSLGGSKRIEEEAQSAVDGMDGCCRILHVSIQDCLTVALSSPVQMKATFALALIADIVRLRVGKDTCCVPIRAHPEEQHIEPAIYILLWHTPPALVRKGKILIVLYLPGNLTWSSMILWMYLSSSFCISSLVGKIDVSARDPVPVGILQTTENDRLQLFLSRFSSDLSNDKRCNLGCNSSVKKIGSL